MPLVLIIVALLALSWGLLRLSWSAQQIWLQTPAWRSVQVFWIVTAGVSCWVFVVAVVMIFARVI